ncbi:hypothetical protein C1637_22285 [Chryseobacterium lactis]|uniref:Right handed beta helix domain-containing protein n=1 Tax=Chryseobacterium lactis TaxID=1241981 RepID=A0A3G6RMA8_CHRLC|nr:right-handed parallel beta-helix repeat-containing protein [Chryseobacterium lactis]AZA85010.1 hypothetical protein EG342_25245 [Chryseobacterium lactis]AZB05398.1 hypothetical protein EG341_16125 [Chryseobacterium lactis]PNW11547.1 hypothetical protein C1637_22285 [Chryseobacterium lactis]
MKYKFLLIILFNSFFSCQKSDFSYLLPPENIINQYTKPYSPNNINLSGWDKLESILKSGYSKNSNQDYTKDIQSFFATHRNILLPDYPIYISIGLKISSNTNVFFQKNSKIIYTGEVKGRHYDIVKIENAENVTLYNPYVVGNREAKLKHTGEWNAGISIQDAKKVTIYNPIIKNTWGDGIFIGSETAGLSEDVMINGGWIDKVRRNGITITSGKNVTVENMLISNTVGTLPQIGLHIEPSLYEEVLDGINIKNVYTYNNASAGLGINLYAFSDKAKPTKNINISIDGFVSNLSNYSMSFSIGDLNNSKKYNGNILIKNSTLTKPGVGYIWKNKDNVEVSYMNMKYK